MARADNDRMELRQQVSKELLDIFDAMSIARGMDRSSLIEQELHKSGMQWVHEMNVLHRVARGNPALAELAGLKKEGGG